MCLQTEMFEKWCKSPPYKINSFDDLVFIKAKCFETVDSKTIINYYNFEIKNDKQEVKQVITNNSELWILPVFVPVVPIQSTAKVFV